MAKKQAAQRHANSGSFKPGDERICRDGAAKSKGRQFQLKLREWLEAKQEDGTTLNDKFQFYLEQIASAGTKQSLDAITMLWDRAYGKPAQSMALSADLNLPVSIAGLIAAGGKAGE